MSVETFTVEPVVYRANLVVPITSERHEDGRWNVVISPMFAVGNIDPAAKVLKPIMSGWQNSSDRAIAQALRNFADMID